MAPAASALAILIQFLVAGPVFAAREIRSITPNPARAGSAIDVRGTGFGLDERRVVYGALGQTQILGDFPLRSGGWGEEVIRCTVPAGTAPGTYWVALARSGGGLQSNRFEPFTVLGTGRAPAGGIDPGALEKFRRGRTPEPGRRTTGQIGAHALKDLAIEGVEPDRDARVQSVNGKVNITVLVRNRGLGEQSFRITAGEARTVSGPLGTRFSTGEQLMSPVNSVRPGETARVPIQVSAQPHIGDDGRFQARLRLASPGTRLPMPYLDKDASNNAIDVRYRIEPVSYTVKARLTHMRVRNDCDSVSEGDWIVALFIESVNGAGDPIIVAVGWPPGNRISSVDAGSTLETDISTSLGGVAPASRVLVSAAAIDCDSDTWLPTVGLQDLGFNCGLHGKCKCGDEDFPEVSGDHDWVGSARVELSPEAWKRANRFDVLSGSGDCGNGAFTAYFEVWSEPWY